MIVLGRLSIYYEGKYYKVLSTYFHYGFFMVTTDFDRKF